MRLRVGQRLPVRAERATAAAGRRLQRRNHETQRSALRRCSRRRSRRRRASRVNEIGLSPEGSLWVLSAIGNAYGSATAPNLYTTLPSPLPATPALPRRGSRVGAPPAPRRRELFERARADLRCTGSRCRRAGRGVTSPRDARPSSTPGSRRWRRGSGSASRRPNLSSRRRSAPPASRSPRRLSV